MVKIIEMKTVEQLAKEYARGETRNFEVLFDNGMFTTNVGKYLLNGDYEIIGNIHDNPELLNN